MPIPGVGAALTGLGRSDRRNRGGDETFGQQSEGEPHRQGRGRECVIRAVRGYGDAGGTEHACLQGKGLYRNRSGIRHRQGSGHIVNLASRKALSRWERFAVSPESCARVILQGVKRNKPIITVTFMEKVMWWLARISPTFMMNFARKDFAKWRDKARSSD